MKATLKPSDVIGKKKKEAVRLIESNGLVCRVSCEDGKWNILTAEINADRFNIEIQDGIVVNAAIG